METTPNGWVVVDRAATVLTNSYVFDGKTATANTFVARLADGKLMVVSPTYKATDDMLDELDTFGEVGALVANNGFHHLGQPQWHKRYPKARCFTPANAMARISKKNPDAPTFEPLSALKPLLGDDVGIGEGEATKCGESWAWARIDGGYAWFCSDLLANMEELPSNFIVKRLFKWTGSAPGYKPFNLVMKFTLKDKRAVLKEFAADLERHPPTVMVPSHGAVLTRDGLAAETTEVVAAAIG